MVVVVILLLLRGYTTSSAAEIPSASGLVCAASAVSGGWAETNTDEIIPQ